VLDVYPPSGAGIAPSRVGTTFALLYAYVHSVRRAPPITLRSIAVDGRGVGSVIQVERVELVPPGAADHAVPETLHLTDPPVYKEDGLCRVADVRSVRGFRLKPGGATRVLAVYRLATPGAYSATGLDVSYRVGAALEHQVLPFRFRGTVRAAGAAAIMPAWERACLDLTHALGAASPTGSS
jgi:hypothetical protein